METTSTTPAVEAGKPSRLPAGSTLELPNGVHVAHPHAEVNLPGAGDPRLGTEAVTEYSKSETVTQAKSGEDKTETITKVSVEQKPLADEVKPKVMTVAESGTPISENKTPVDNLGAASTTNGHLAVEVHTPEKTV